MKIKTQTRKSFLVDDKDVEILANRIAPLVFQGSNFIVNVLLATNDVGSVSEQQTLTLHATVKNIVRPWKDSESKRKIEAHTLSSVRDLEMVIEDFFVRLLHSSCASDLDYVANNGAIQDEQLARILGNDQINWRLKQQFVALLLQRTCHADFESVRVRQNDANRYTINYSSASNGTEFITYFTLDPYMLDKHPLSIQKQISQNNRPQEEAKIYTHIPFYF